MSRHAAPKQGEFPQLEQVLDGERFATILQRALHEAGADLKVRRVKVRRLYYRPDRSCRLLLECRLVGPDGVKLEQLYFGRFWRDGAPHPNRDATQESLTLPALGPALLVVPELRLELRAYPNDPDLPGLAFLADPKRVLGWLQASPERCGVPQAARVLSSSGDLAKYVPGQRCGFRFALRWRDGRGMEETRRVYAKAYQPERGRAVAATLREIEATEACQSGALRVPRIVDFDAGRGILWQECISGTKLSKDESARGLLQNASGAGRSLAAFHASTLSLGPGKDLSSQIADLRKAQAALARSYPAYREECTRITTELLAMVPSLPPVPRAPVHGSFKSSHLFEEDGQLVLIDFDGAGLGDPIYDVGRFLARVVAGGAHSLASEETIRAILERFQQSYRQGVPWGWPETRVRWSTCAHLIGSQVYKSVKRANTERVAATLRVAGEWLPDISKTSRIT